MSETKRMTDEELAASLGLRIVRAGGWGQREIQDPGGKVLDTCGVDSVRSWLNGYRAGVDAAALVVGEAHDAAVRSVERMRPVCAPTDTRLCEMAFAAEALGTQVDRIRAMGATTPCPNPECRGGYFGGEDPHACGQC